MASLLPLLKEQPPELLPQLKSEFCLLIWFPEYTKLPAIDFQDFYSKLKQLLADLYSCVLQDHIHRNKVQYFIDNINQQNLLPEDVCNFFDNFWSNGTYQDDILCQMPLKWEKKASQKKL